MILLFIFQFKHGDIGMINNVYNVNNGVHVLNIWVVHN